MKKKSLLDELDLVISCKPAKGRLNRFVVSNRARVRAYEDFVGGDFILEALCWRVMVLPFKRINCNITCAVTLGMWNPPVHIYMRFERPVWEIWDIELMNYISRRSLKIRELGSINTSLQDADPPEQFNANVLITVGGGGGSNINPPSRQSYLILRSWKKIASWVVKLWSGSGVIYELATYPN